MKKRTLDRQLIESIVQHPLSDANEALLRRRWGAG